MPFGIPSEDFHGGFGIPEDEICVINYDDTDGEVERDDYDPYTGKYAFCPPMTDEEFTQAYKDYMDEYRTDDDDDVSDEEYEAAAQEVHDNLVRSLIEAGSEIRELTDEKKRLIFALKSTLVWLNYFLTTEPDDVYHDEAREARCNAELLLMELEE